MCEILSAKSLRTKARENSRYFTKRIVHWFPSLLPWKRKLKMPRQRLMNERQRSSVENAAQKGRRGAAVPAKINITPPPPSLVMRTRAPHFLQKRVWHAKSVDSCVAGGPTGKSFDRPRVPSFPRIRGEPRRGIFGKNFGNATSLRRAERKIYATDEVAIQRSCNSNGVRSDARMDLTHFRSTRPLLSTRLARDRENYRHAKVQSVPCGLLSGKNG